MKNKPKLIDNPELGKTLGKNAYEHVKANFSSQANIQKLESFFDKVLGC